MEDTRQRVVRTLDVAAWFRIDLSCSWLFHHGPRRSSPLLGSRQDGPRKIQNRFSLLYRGELRVSGYTSLGEPQREFRLIFSASFYRFFSNSIPNRRAIKVYLLTGASYSPFTKNSWTVNGSKFTTERMPRAGAKETNRKAFETIRGKIKRQIYRILTKKYEWRLLFSLSYSYEDRPNGKCLFNASKNSCIIQNIFEIIWGSLLYFIRCKLRLVCGRRRKRNSKTSHFVDNLYSGNFTRHLHRGLRSRGLALLRTLRTSRDVDLRNYWSWLP